jgi:replicative DNA helicase
MSIEKRVVGTLIAFPDKYTEVSDLIGQGCFSEPDTKAIFETFVRLYAEDASISYSLIQERILKSENPCDVKSVIDYLDSGSSFIEHCQILKEKEVKREQLKLAAELMSKAGDVKEDPFETNDYLMEQAERVVSMVDFGKKNTNIQLVDSVRKKMETAQQSSGMTGVKTGFNELDKVYGGRQKSDLIIKAARPAMGKTSQALCEAKHMAFEEDKRVIFFSLEMSAEQLMQRLVSVHTGIPLGTIRAGKLDPDQWDNYNKNADYLTNDNLIIVDDVYSLNGIRTRCKKLKMKGGLDAIYIDYLQLITHKVDKGRSKEQEVSEISRALKMLAKSLDVPIVCLSQLSRAVETRGGTHKPMLSDLRDSGAIEQDADIVEFIFRPEYYEKEDPNLHGVAYVIIAKHRNGACGDIELRFKHECTRFENADGYVVPPEVRPSVMVKSNEFEDPPF